MRNGRAWVILAAAGLLVAGCSSSTASYGIAEAIDPPPGDARPDPSTFDRQLDALPHRDTAGLEPTSANAWVDDLGELIEHAWTLRPQADALLSVRAYESNVHVNLVNSAQPNLELGLMFSAGNPGEPYVAEPRYTEAEPFPADSVDFDVPRALLGAIATRRPDVRVTDVVLNRSSSYGFGLVWNLSVVDARGSLATVFADLGGVVLAVDPA